MSQEEYDRLVKAGYRALHVTEPFYKVLTRSRYYQTPVIVAGPTFEEKVKMWLDVWSAQIPDEAVEELEALFEEEN